MDIQYRFQTSIFSFSLEPAKLFPFYNSIKRENVSHIVMFVSYFMSEKVEEC